ncbi:hypothetical protein FJT64_017516 [Amphibalanus amphitrite]|uniref:C2H2-type domain-containing protein n=1 Tax=Amphibalanus amphitrite TaxID=1232801 RepID=A0A6A4XBD0_AMPAM|nr:hypothetical protein FJT64_017516 [Amphibalanus amphitrite]
MDNALHSWFSAAEGWMCPEPGCGKWLRNSKRLSDHRAWHRGDTQCPVCHRRLSDKHYLREHAWNVHNLVLPPLRGRRWPAYHRGDQY